MCIGLKCMIFDLLWIAMALLLPVFFNRSDKKKGERGRQYIKKVINPYLYFQIFDMVCY